MKVTVRLHDEYYRYLLQFGLLQEVIDRILQSICDKQIDFEQFDKVPDVKGARNLTVEIDNPFYLELVDTYGIHNYKISIRRMLYWFVDYDMGNEWGWAIIKQNSLPIKMTKYLKQMEHSCNLALKNATSEQIGILLSIRDLIQQLKI